MLNQSNIFAILILLPTISMKKSGGTIIQRKGATFYAIAISVCHLLECIFSQSNTSMTVSSMMHVERNLEVSSKVPEPITLSSGILETFVNTYVIISTGLLTITYKEAILQ